MESLLGDSILAILACQLPDDEGLVPGAGEDHVGILGVGGDLGHPAIVAPEGATELQRLSHSLLLLHFLVCKKNNLIHRSSVFTYMIF